MTARVRCNGMYLDAIAEVSGLRYSELWRPGSGYSGPWEASWNWAGDAKVTPTFVRRGARVELVEAGRVIFGGLLTETERGSPSKMGAVGYGKEGSRFLSLQEDEEVPQGVDPTWNANTAVDVAIDRGLKWIRGGDLGSVPADTENPDPLYVDQLLDRTAKGLGKIWHVDEQGIVRMVETIYDVYGQRPAIGLAPGDVPRMGTADPDYVSAIYGYYIYDPPPAGGTTNAVATPIRDDAAEDRFGVQEEWIDYRKLGPLSGPSIVAADVGNRLKLAGARMQYTGSVTGDENTLRLLGCGPIRPTMIHAGETLRIFGMLDGNGSMHLGGSTDVTIGQVEVDCDAMTVTLTPVGFAPRDLNSILSDPEKSELSEREQRRAGRL